jgi:hypothetical protein
MATATKKKTEEADQDRPFHKTASVKVKSGHIMAIVHYVKVNDIWNAPSDNAGMSVTSLDEGNTGSFRVEGRVLIENALSADQYQEEVTVTKTKAAEILVSSANRPLTVTFEKQDGEMRMLRGRLVKPEPLLGRSMCEDLDIGSGYRLRLVDHRTIHSLIVDGVRYVVKGA